MHRQVLALREKINGPVHPSVAVSLGELALLRRRKGDFAGAETLYTRSLAVWEKTLGMEDPAAATSLHNLGELYSAMGDFARAERYYLRALAIREKKLGENHRETAFTLNNLGLLYRDQEQWAKAEGYYRRALAVKERLFGPEHPSTGVSVNNLGELYFAQNDLARAEPYFKRALAINEKVFGPAHPDTAVILNNLADLYRRTGRAALAEPLFLRVLAIREKSLGPNHPDVAAVLNNLAGLYVAQGQYDKVMPVAGRAQAITATLLDQILGFTAEDQKLAFLANVRWEMDAYLSFIAKYMQARPAAVRAGYDVWLRRKGVVLDAQRRAQEALAAAGGPEARAAMQELEKVRAELSRLAFAPLGTEDGAARQKRLDALERRKGELQASLSRLSQPFALDQKLRRVDAAQVAAALPPGSALVGIARVKSPLGDPKAVGKARFEDRYLAFVLPANRPEALRLVNLGAARPIDAAVAAYKKAILENKADELARQARPCTPWPSSRWPRCSARPRGCSCPRTGP
jgi:tetratricopeptide (TPR) repeat protein